MPDYFFDTVSISNFALTGSLSLLVTRYAKHLFITQEVFNEITEGIVYGYTKLREIDTLVSAGKIKCSKPLTGADRHAYSELLQMMGSGEASTIVCAGRAAGIVVTDDRVARSHCEQRNIEYTGTIGILKALCRDGLMSASEADELLDAMIENGFYSPVNTISGLL